MSKVKCNVCGKRFEEMTEDTMEFNYRYFTPAGHEYNNIGRVKLCKSCTRDFIGTTNVSMGVRNDPEEE